MSVEDIRTEYWACHYFENPNDAQEEYENPDFDDDVKEMFGDDNDWETLT